MIDCHEITTVMDIVSTKKTNTIVTNLISIVSKTATVKHEEIAIFCIQFY